MSTRIFVVEDDPNIRLGLVDLLRTEEYEVLECERGDTAFEAIAAAAPHLIVMDVMLPGMSGFDLCRKLRKQGIRAPILMLTAKGQELDKVVGLDSGADDYVTKPFGVRELLARINALLRRSAPRNQEPDSFVLGSSSVDAKRFTLTRGEEQHDLSEKEVKLLRLFHAHPGEVMSRDRLLNEVWGYNYYGTTRTLDQTIVQLRKKLGADAALIGTVHGVGYRLTT